MSSSPRCCSLRLGGLVGRPASEQSLDSVAACVRSSFDYFRRTGARRSIERTAADRLFESLADPHRRLFVLEHSGRPAGLLELELHCPRPAEATLVLLVLDPALRRQGLGRDAARLLFEQLGSVGFRRVRLGVARGERAAHAFWSSVGMWPSEERADGVTLFELPLAPGQAAARSA